VVDAHIDRELTIMVIPALIVETTVIVDALSRCGHRPLRFDFLFLYNKLMWEHGLTQF
jgi:hypothetical protein